MATAKELLIEELRKRQAQQQLDDDKTRSMIKNQEDIAMIDAGYRTNLQPQAAFIDELTGSNLARAVEKPESTLTALRKALNARYQMPRQKTDALLGAVAKQEAAEAKASQPGKMSGETMKRLGSARVAQQALSDVEAALGQGSSILPEFLTGATGDTAFTEASRRFAEGFGRMQSGAAITADEEVRFKRLLPRFQDSPEIRAIKLQRLQEEITARMGELGGPSSAPASTGIGSDGSVDMSQMSEEQLRKMAGM